MIQYAVRAVREQHDISVAPYHQYIVDDRVWAEFFRLDNKYMVRFPTLADFEVNADGTSVSAHPTDSADEPTIEHLFNNQIMPLAFSRQGRPTYHASVVTMGGGAIAFIGESGFGKSTLATSFALEDEAFMTDDALLIDETNTGCIVQPSHASLRLWDDSAETLVSADSLRADPISYSTKSRLLAGGALSYCEEPRPLSAAYVLADNGTTDISIKKLTGLDCFMGWISNSFLLDIEDHDLLKQHFDWTHRISAAIPTFSLDYPREYGMLPEVRAALRSHFEDLGY